MTTNSNKKWIVPYILVVVANAISLSVYVAIEPFSLRWTLIILVGGLMLIALGMFRLKTNNFLTTVLANLQVSLFFLVVTCISVQLLFSFVPEVFPLQLQNLIAREIKGESIDDLRGRVVEYLPYSPYAKPKPNVVIRVPGNYGPESDFVYEWQTDFRGFKNGPDTASLERIPIVAVGDSYVEGLGVTTDQTWCCILTDRGFTTYSLGVQGYAPSQMAGVFKHYGVGLNPKWVIAGYLGNIYLRERYFFKTEEEIFEDKDFPSAIGGLVKSDLQSALMEVKEQYKFVITGILSLLRKQLLVWRQAKKYAHQYAEDPRFMREAELRPDDRIVLGPMQRYRREIFALGQRVVSREELTASREWQSALNAFSSIIEEAQIIDAKVVIIMFRNRGNMYFERATGEKLPANYGDDIEAELLREFCQENGCEFLDTAKTFRTYIAGIDELTPINEYPYLRYDGHPSPKGHELIAELLLEFLNTRGIKQSSSEKVST